MLQAKIQDLANKYGWGSQLSKGIEAELWVRETLTRLGYRWERSTELEDRQDDIDLWVWIDGVREPVSIKRQDAGLKYNNIYFELKAQTKGGFWIDSWYHKGRATVYAIIQGDQMSLYRKADLVDYVSRNGWLKTRRLSAKTKATQGGSYSLIDAECGFLYPDSVKPFLKKTIVRSLPLVA